MNCATSSNVAQRLVAKVARGELLEPVEPGRKLKSKHLERKSPFFGTRALKIAYERPPMSPAFAKVAERHTFAFRSAVANMIVRRELE